jgi:ribosomal protein S18 acetylase RimI-like enzyme
VNTDTSSQLRYRRATLADGEALRQLNIRAYGGYQHILLPQDWALMKTRMEDEVAFRELMGKATAFVCEDGKEIAGAVYLMPSGNPTEYFDAEWAYIRLLGVLPAYRGQGIASELMRQCIEEAQARGEDVLALHTSAYQSAWHIYERLGFVKQKDIGPLLGHEYWLYTRRLRSDCPNDDI